MQESENLLFYKSQASLKEKERASPLPTPIEGIKVCKSEWAVSLASYWIRQKAQTMRMSHGELSQLSRKGVNSQEVKFEQGLVKFNRPREVVNKHAERKAD